MHASVAQAAIRLRLKEVSEEIFLKIYHYLKKRHPRKDVSKVL